MKAIGVTGSYCSGLEHMNEVFSYHEYPVFQADLAIKFLLNWREDILSQVRIRFGYDITSSGYLQPHQFEGTEKFDRLIDIIEVDLLLMWEKFLLKHKNAPLVFFSSYIIFERDWNKRFKKTIFIYKPFKERLTDIMYSQIISGVTAEKNKNKEMSDIEKTNRANYVIHNHDNLSLLSQFEAVKDQILYGNVLF
jgi:dephospho-CoA kinase